MICSKGRTKGPHQKYQKFVFTSDWQFHSWNSIKPSYFLANPDAKLTAGNSEKHLEALFSVVSLMSCWWGSLSHATVSVGISVTGHSVVRISFTRYSVGWDLCHTPQWRFKNQLFLSHLPQCTFHSCYPDISGAGIQGVVRGPISSSITWDPKVFWSQWDRDTEPPWFAYTNLRW